MEGLPRCHAGRFATTLLYLVSSVMTFASAVAQYKGTGLPRRMAVIWLTLVQWNQWLLCQMCWSTSWKTRFMARFVRRSVIVNRWVIDKWVSKWWLFVACVSRQCCLCRHVATYEWRAMNGAVHRPVSSMAIDIRSEVVFVVWVTNVVVRDVEEWTQTKTTNN